MRNFILLALIMGVLGMTACREEENELTQEDVVGTWDMNGFGGNVDATIAAGGASQTTKSTFSISDSDVKITFNANGSWTSTGSYTITVNVTTSGQTSTDMGTGGIGSGTYSISDGKLVMKDIEAGNNVQAEEITLSSKSFTADKKLELEGEGTQMVNDPIFGLNVTTKIKLNMLLER